VPEAAAVRRRTRHQRKSRLIPSVAIFVYDLSATGVVRNALAIANRLAAAGWDVEVVTCRGGTAFAAERAGLRTVTLGIGGEPASRSGALLRAVSRLGRHLRGREPDILLSAGNHAHPICWAASRRLRRARTVYRISNDLEHRGGARRSLKAIFRRFSTRLLARDERAHLVLVSPHLLREPVLETAARRGKASVIPNGVAVAEVRRRMMESGGHPWLEGDVPVAVGIGRLVPQKNFAGLLHAVARANATRPLRLIVLGAGPQREALASLAGRLNIADRVDLAGVVPNPFPYLRRASVFVLPSFWEGAPNVLLEALACGAPAVASRTAGNADEILDGGRYGLLVDPDDADGMAEAILRQLDPARRVAPGGRAETFDIGMALDAYASLFERLAASNPAARA